MSNERETERETGGMCRRGGFINQIFYWCLVLVGGLVWYGHLPRFLDFSICPSYENYGPPLVLSNFSFSNSEGNGEVKELLQAVELWL